MPAEHAPGSLSPPKGESFRYPARSLDDEGFPVDPSPASSEEGPTFALRRGPAWGALAGARLVSFRPYDTYFSTTITLLVTVKVSDSGIGVVPTFAVMVSPATGSTV